MAPDSSVTWYTIPKLAKRVGVHPSTVRSWIRTKRVTLPEQHPATGTSVYSEEIASEIGSFHGAGPYVIAHMLRLLGTYDELAIDSWVRSKYARLYHGGRRVSDRTIARGFGRFGEWKGLALWCDLTSDWSDEGGIA